MVGGGRRGENAVCNIHIHTRIYYIVYSYFIKLCFVCCVVLISNYGNVLSLSWKSICHRCTHFVNALYPRVSDIWHLWQTIFFCDECFKINSTWLLLVLCIADPGVPTLSKRDTQHASCVNLISGLEMCTHSVQLNRMLVLFADDNFTLLLYCD